MLTRGHVFALALAASTAPLAGCLITTGPGGVGGFGGSGTSVTSGGSHGNTGVTSGTSATGVTSGTGVTGATGTTTSTGSGMPGCTDPAGTGLPSSRCSMMANAPSTCPSTGVAPAQVSVCTKGYQIYRAGQWEELEACLEMIPTQDVCATAAQIDIGNCINTMYAHACANPDAVTQCNAIASSCAASNDPSFATEACKADLIAFSTAGINAYTQCVNASSTVKCVDLHNTCFAQVTSY